MIDVDPKLTSSPHDGSHVLHSQLFYGLDTQGLGDISNSDPEARSEKRSFGTHWGGICVGVSEWQAVQQDNSRDDHMVVLKVQHLFVFLR
jgi:hypothetical protein